MSMKKTKTIFQKNFVYGNTCNKIEGFARRLEYYLDFEDKLCNHKVLTLHGNLIKEEKILVISSFSKKGFDNKN